MSSCSLQTTTIYTISLSAYGVFGCFDSSDGHISNFGLNRSLYLRCIMSQARSLLVLLLCTEGYDQDFKVILYKGVVILLVPTVA